ncbi:MAG: biopolymer transporter ExbD [Candidatus Omnitrophica bacterium]|jgi:biopolymer transport protein ExbD|nr:biopolymer transporter ExbD [Candidatus Omnitrophota bacterium]
MKFEHLKRRTSIRKGQLDIAPLVDVMFLLLIFFMLTSNFVLQPGIRVRLPKAVTSEVIDSENLIVTVTAQDLIYLNFKPIQKAALSDLLDEASRHGSSVLIKSDVGASVGKIVELWDLCRRSGISKVNIATNQPGADV